MKFWGEGLWKETRGVPAKRSPIVEGTCEGCGSLRCLGRKPEAGAVWLFHSFVLGIGEEAGADEGIGLLDVG